MGSIRNPLKGKPVYRHTGVAISQQQELEYVRPVAPRGLDGFESPVEVFSPTVCEEDACAQGMQTMQKSSQCPQDLLAKDTMKHWGTAPSPAAS